MLGTIWSTSSGVTAIIDTLNAAYDIQESRPWWKVRLIAVGLTIALAVFIVISFALVLVGPTLAEKVAVWARPTPSRNGSGSRRDRSLACDPEMATG